MNIDVLVGKTLVGIENHGDEMLFTTSEGEQYRLYHEQDCCESVRVEDICGHLDDLIGNPLLYAEETTNRENSEGMHFDNLDSFTWTFYHLRTLKGTVTIRWLGVSNGYYSESVDFERVL